MKNILFAAVLLISFVGYSQEDKSYELINDHTVEVTVTTNGTITQRGEMVSVNGILKTNGIWRQYDKDNKVTLRVMYSKGRRLWVEKDLGAYVVTSKTKGSI